MLPQGTNVEAIEARAENGVLTISIPKVQAATARKVEVKGGGLVDKAKKIFARTTSRRTPDGRAFVTDSSQIDQVGSVLT